MKTFSELSAETPSGALTCPAPLPDEAKTDQT
jgi:hypothetical protein